MISILLVDDQRVIREGLKALLEPEPDIEVIGVAANGHECLEQVEALRPDVALIDVEMPRMDGLSATKVIATRFNFCKVLILSSYDDAQLVTQALDVGAKGYLLKDIKATELASVIRAVYRGYNQSRQDLVATLPSVKALLLDQMPSEIATVTSQIESIQQKLELVQDKIENQQLDLKNVVKIKAQVEESSASNTKIKDDLAVFHSQWNKDRQALLSSINELNNKYRITQAALNDNLDRMLRLVKHELNAMQLRLNIALWIIFFVLGTTILLLVFKLS